MPSRIKSILGIILSFFITSESFALGGANIGNEAISSIGLGAGGTGIAAVSGDPMDVFSNPAGLTALPGTQMTFGGVLESMNGKYEADSGQTQSTRSVNAFVPNFALTHSFNDGKIGAGLGVLSAYGLETHWGSDSNSPLRYIATNSRLHMVDITPSVAYKVNSMFSVGVGADYVNLFDATLQKNVNVTNLNGAIGFPSAGPDADSKLSGTANSWGYHAGVTFQPTEQHALGVAYHSKIKLGINGSEELTGLSGISGASFGPFGGSNFSTSANTTIYLPQNVQLGYAFKPNKQWILEADAAWYNWSANKILGVQYPNATPAQVALLTNNGSGNPLPLNFRDVWSFSTGATYKYDDQLKLRTGFWYEPWAQPESAFNPGLLDLTRYGLCVGTGYQFTQEFGMDFAYNAVFTHNRHITNTLGQDTTGDPSTNIDGTFENFINLVSANFNYKFGGNK